MIPLYSEKMLISDPVLESYNITLSEKGLQGYTSDTKLYPPVPNGLSCKVSFSMNIPSTGVTLEKGYLYRFTIISSGYENVTTGGMRASVNPNSFVAGLSVFTGTFPLCDNNSNFINSLKQGSVGYFTPSETGELKITPYIKHGTTGANNNNPLNILIEKLPLDFIKPEKYYHYKTSNMLTFTWTDTETSPSGYTRDCEGDIYINEIP